MTSRRSQSISAVCGLLAGPMLFLATGLGVLAQPDEFSLINHENSDLGAETANRAWLANQLGSNLPGLLLLAFAIGLWRSLGRHRSGRIGSALVGAAGVGIFLSGFLRLDCRHIDRGCDQVASWHGAAHNVDGGLTAIAILLAPFVVARALKLSPGWNDLWIPTLVLGIATIAAVIGGGAIGDGAASLLGALVWLSWIAILATRMLRLSWAAAPATSSLAPH